MRQFIARLRGIALLTPVHARHYFLNCIGGGYTGVELVAELHDLIYQHVGPIGRPSVRPTASLASIPGGMSRK